MLHDFWLIQKTTVELPLLGIHVLIIIVKDYTEFFFFLCARHKIFIEGTSCAKYSFRLGMGKWSIVKG